MAFLNTSALLIQQLEVTAGTAIPNMETVDTSVRVRELDFSLDISKDDESSRYLTGDFAGNDESIIGMKTGTASYSIKLAPGEYTPVVTVDDAEHKLNYKDYFANAGLELVEIGTDATDDTEGLYAFYPSADQASNTATVARILRDSDSSTSSLETLAGCMSNLTIAVDGVGSPFTASFETQGRVENVEDVITANVSGFNEANVMRTVADNFLNTTVTITDLVTDVATTFCLSSMTLETGNELNMVECQDNAAGIKNYLITAMDPTIEIDPLLKTLADFDYWEALTEEKMYRVEVESEFIKVVLPRTQILNSAIGDSNGFMRNTLTMRALRNIDEYVPTEITTPPTNIAQAMYYVIINESVKNY